MIARQQERSMIEQALVGVAAPGRQEPRQIAGLFFFTGASRTSASWERASGLAPKRRCSAGALRGQCYSTWVDSCRSPPLGRHTNQPREQRPNLLRERTLLAPAQPNLSARVQLQMRL